MQVTRHTCNNQIRININIIALTIRNVTVRLKSD